MIDLIKKELFVKGVKLIASDDPMHYGRYTIENEVFYFQNEAGYFIYLPKIALENVNDRSVFDPISPTSFRWCFFNRQIIFVPFGDIEFKKMYKLHPQLNDYLIAFNLDYYERYKKVFIESENKKAIQYFLIRIPYNYCYDFVHNRNTFEHAMIPIKDSKESTVDISTGVVSFLHVMPEFLQSNTVMKVITLDNLDDIWKHWLAAQYSRILDSRDSYNRKFSDDEWVNSIVTHLILENLVAAEKPVELDPGLKALLGL